MILQNGNSHDTDSQDVTSDNNSESNAMTSEDSNSDAASSVSSTPLMEIKKAKMRKQQQQQQQQLKERASKKQKVAQPKAGGKRSAASSTKTASDKPKANETKAKKKLIKESPTPVRAKSAKAMSAAKVKTPTKQSSNNKGKTKDATTAIAKAKKAKDAESPKTPQQSKQKSESSNDDDVSMENSSKSNSSESSEEEVAACCMCHCGVDCSDRALFFAKDRKAELEEDEDYYFGLDDPYLDGDKFYDRNNALVYCDTCNRLYHQKCHFVPLLVVPRGEFHCLICTIQKQQQQKKAATPKKKRNTKQSQTHHPPDPPVPEKFLKRKLTDQLFQSPPTQSTLDIKKLQHEFEVASGPAKAKLWNLQFKQLRTFLKSQASNIRMANTTLATMTSTKRNRQHFLQNKKGTKSSQELAQTLCKLTGAKFKIREALLSLESIRINNESIDFASLYAWCQENSEHAEHVFPFGSTLCKESRRIVPRTRERKQEEKKCSSNKIPTEITLGGKSATSDSKKTKDCTKASKKNGKSADDNGNDDDDDSGITLDDLQCAVCMIGDATDENDVLLCDGKDCHRAFHMKCVHPHVKPEDIENEDEDWFCPICSQSAELMGEIHDLCVADENEEASTGSWDSVHDVFPNSQWEYETAQKILKGKRNEDTQRLLAMFLGEDIHKQKVQMPVGSDSEDENDYSLFDEDSFQERRQQEKSDDESVASSQATLLDYDDIDYKVGKAELAALSEEEGSGSDSDDDDDESENQIRRSRRLVKKEEEEESNPLEFGADFDEANIIEGKRKRKRVNYRKLNDMMFGDLSDHQQGIIDGGDDFDAPKPAKKESDNESGNNESGSDSGNESGDDGSGNASGDESGDDGSGGGSDDGSGDDGSGDDGSDDSSSD